jgi:hypothetical protein
MISPSSVSPHLLIGFVFLLALRALSLGAPAQDASAYAEAVAKINSAHARQPGKNTESQLSQQLPAAPKAALKRVLETKSAPDLVPALMKCGEAALDLDQLPDFEAVRARLQIIDPAAAAKLGTAVSRPRFILRGIGALEADYLEKFAEVFDAILAAYDDVFGFKELSKVPGKKLRVRIHLEPAITSPPHFAPEFPWHSEIDFPVVDPAQLASPTAKGQFLFYGLCHELGHVVAMWGDIRTMEDQHSWAHYTGVTIAEHLAQAAGDKPFMQALRDVRWRSLTLERGLPANQVPPSTKDPGSIMALFIALHDAVGPKTIGAALNRLDEQRKNTRVNFVRYYRLADFRRALEEMTPDAGKRAAVAKAFGS